jgi:hypothetical protein
MAFDYADKSTACKEVVQFHPFLFKEHDVLPSKFGRNLHNALLFCGEFPTFSALLEGWV